uniref:Uncharacterized protein n=1 Tax=viral metagenome TaxID=1070528 RepID=A0A6M3K0R5_9ZZZZ
MRIQHEAGSPESNRKTGCKQVVDTINLIGTKLMVTFDVDGFGGLSISKVEPLPEPETKSNLAFNAGDWIVEPSRSPHPYQFMSGMIIMRDSRFATHTDFEVERNGVKVLIQERQGTVFPYNITINKKRMPLPSYIAIPLAQFMGGQIAPEGVK